MYCLSELLKLLLPIVGYKEFIIYMKSQALANLKKLTFDTISQGWSARLFVEENELKTQYVLNVSYKKAKKQG